MSGTTADMADMARRNTRFETPREPLRQETNLRIQKEKTSGPIPFLNPTGARFTLMARLSSQRRGVESDSDDDSNKGSEDTAFVGGSDQNLPSNVEYKYSNRDNRKGRHTLVVRSTEKGKQPVITPPPTSSFRHILSGIWRMFTCFPVWDISWLVAFIFTLGSVVWVLNGFFVFLPFVPKKEFKGQVLYGGGITAFIGATIFEIGSALLLLEAINENRTGCFGWAVEHLGDGEENEHGAASKAVPATDNCSHHHQNTMNVVGQPSLMSRLTNPMRPNSTPEGEHSWVWWPSSTELRTHYSHDLGFIASLIQGIAATIFWISGLTALPGLFDHMSNPIVDAFYWTPQVVGASGFVMSGFLFMLETQRHWWTPSLGTLGWHVGLWNLIGGVGFLLCPCFGYSSAHWAQYQASLSSFWGSWSFLIGSTLQWYESLEKHPVVVKKQRQ